jgi:hypothetical protein
MKKKKIKTQKKNIKLIIVPVIIIVVTNLHCRVLNKSNFSTTYIRRRSSEIKKQI